MDYFLPEFELIDFVMYDIIHIRDRSARHLVKYNFVFYFIFMYTNYGNCVFLCMKFFPIVNTFPCPSQTVQAFVCYNKTI